MNGFKLKSWHLPLTLFQVSSLKEEITKVREVLANTENSSAEEIKELCNELQQKSLKLFEMAYKKVMSWWMHSSKNWREGLFSA